MHAFATSVVKSIQSASGAILALKTAHESEWAGQWPTDRCGEVLVSEMPGDRDGSIFGYWLGEKSLACDQVLSSIKKHVDNHDAVGLYIIYCFPSDTHPSLRTDLEQLKEAAKLNRAMKIREGFRVRVIYNQGNIGGDRYPGRVGIVQSENGNTGEYWNVRLAPTVRAKERIELFRVSALDPLTTIEELHLLPPMSGSAFATRFESAESLLFAGVSYALVQHQVFGKQDGWAVSAIYPDGSKKLFGERHPLTRSLAITTAGYDAMDWWLNRRDA